MWRVLKLKKNRFFFFHHFKCFRKNVRKLCRSYVKFVSTRNPTKHCCRQRKKTLGHLYQKNIKNDQKRVMFGHYIISWIPVATKAKMKGSPNCSANIWGIGWPASLIHSPDQQVCWGREKPTLKQTVSTSRISSPFIWMHFNLFAVHLEDASE